jgi:hypothetical protein
MRTSIGIIAIAVMGTLYGCAANGAANSTTNTDVSNAVTQTVVSPTPTPTAKPGENECKICDFDYASYKGELNRDEINGLLLALNDEYLAIATYEQVNKDHNSPRPFVNIVDSERRHADMLKELFGKYGLAVPENPWTGGTPKYESVAEACKAGVEGEIINRDLYTRLFKSTERKDILDTYTYLQRASVENHLPAFERCGGAGGGRGPGGGGPGRGRGPGRVN